ncbi:MAG: hypothetical protein ACPGEG_07195 [Salibacteraceae bacterium]
MEVVWEIVKISIPALAVMITTYFVLKQMLDSQYKRRELELRREFSRSMSPTKIAAYERLVLLLERIHPAEMVLRIHQKGMTSQKFHAELSKNVRDEYQHNLTQQIYISTKAWGYIKNSKEETLKLINMAGSRTSPEASAVDLSNMIFQLMSKMEHQSVDVAKDFLKQELRKTLK